MFITYLPRVAGKHAGRLVVQTNQGTEASIPLSGLAVDSDTGPASAQAPASGGTSNDEEKAQTLINDKRFSFEALLAKNPLDVANSETVFALTKDSERKLRIASILVSRSIPDRRHLDYLMTETKKVLSHDHDMPWPTLYDDRKMPSAFNPELNEWCKQHGVRFFDMHDVEYYELTRPWYFLAAAGDARAYDLLVEGLHSRNLMIVGTAAQGLAKLQDPRAIDVLISRGREVPGEALGAIVQSLVYFQDQRAQKAANELMPDPEKNMLEVLRRSAKERGVAGLFPW
ncbi:MAG TPA: HEAT repeat domain-containing protein [Vicinamibacterales bacterium]|nr:HEAT repeat domain-containing protein [Vicinamibacterales bacterium]